MNANVVGQTAAGAGTGAMYAGVPGAAIGGGTALLGALLGLAAQRKQREQQANISASQEAAAGARNSQQMLQTGTQNALGQLLGAYQSALR